MNQPNSDAASLPSWTRTLNEPEAGTLLDAAVPGESVDAWAALTDGLLPQASVPRRRELIRIVREDLLDHTASVIDDTAFLSIFRGGTAHRRKGLLWGRLLSRRPLVEPVLEALVLPALRASDTPLAPHDADVVPSEAWDSWLYAVLRPGIPSEAFKKTRSTLQTALASAGVLQFEANRARTTHVIHAEPDPVAWSWIVADELARGGGENDESWALRGSFAARLFGTRHEYGMACIEAGIGAGLLRRSYLAGVPRLLVGAR